MNNTLDLTFMELQNKDREIKARNQRALEYSNGIRRKARTIVWSAITALFIILIIININIFSIGADAEVVEDERFYALTTVVVRLDIKSDIVTIEDFNGNLWEFTGVEDWDLYDICSVVMFNNNTTDTIYDDQIIDAYYNGY